MGLFSSIGHFLFGGKTKKAETDTTTTASQTTNPWGPVAPQLASYLNDTTNLYNNTPLYSDQELAANAATKAANDAAINAPMFSPEEIAANNRTLDLANNLSTQPLFSPEEAAANSAFFAGNTQAYNDLQPAIAENNKTISGAYLSPDTNPYLADIAKRVSGMAGANASATFGGKGRSGGGLAGYYSGKAVGDSLTDLYGNEYNTERGLQEAAVGRASGLSTTSSDLLGRNVTLGTDITNRPFDRAAQLKDPYAAASAVGESISSRPFEYRAAIDPSLTSNAALGSDVTSRPFQRNAQYGGILTGLAGLGSSTTGTSSSTQNVYGQSPGLIGSIFNAAANKVFGTSRSTS
jgi:hypothetical protein